MTVEFPRWNKIRELLALLAGLREIRDPLVSEPGLRQSLELLLRLAEMVGVDPAWTARLRRILAEPGIFAIVLAIVQYALGTPAERTTDDTIRMAAANGAVELHAADFADWLPLVIQLIHLLRELRGFSQPSLFPHGTPTPAPLSGRG
ncbi:MAG: hypothetical protein AB7O62_24525 [Pirellulales bacterium]